MWCGGGTERKKKKGGGKVEVGGSRGLEGGSHVR